MGNAWEYLESETCERCAPASISDEGLFSFLAQHVASLRLSLPDISVIVCFRGSGPASGHEGTGRGSIHWWICEQDQSFFLGSETRATAYWDRHDLGLAGRSLAAGPRQQILVSLLWGLAATHNSCWIKRLNLSLNCHKHLVFRSVCVIWHPLLVISVLRFFI